MELAAALCLARAKAVGTSFFRSRLTVPGSVHPSCRRYSTSMMNAGRPWWTPLRIAPLLRGVIWVMGISFFIFWGFVVLLGGLIEGCFHCGFISAPRRSASALNLYQPRQCCVTCFGGL